MSALQRSWEAFTSWARGGFSLVLGVLFWMAIAGTLSGLALEALIFFLGMALKNPLCVIVWRVLSWTIRTLWFWAFGPPKGVRPLRRD